MKIKQKIKDIMAAISGRTRREVGDNFPSIPEPATPSYNRERDYLIDFRPDRFLGQLGGAPTTSVPTPATANNFQVNTVETVTIAVKPKDVLHELGRVPSRWSLEGLDEKISILKDKRELITQQFAAQEVEGLILCLENRKKFDAKSKLAGKTYREFFGQFDLTDHLKVEELCQKHKLRLGSADIYIPEFPDDAVKVMKECSDITQELCGKKPRFLVIANEDQFRDAFGKRDPILLVQSPFGFYYHILGAWDKEMLYLPEL